MLAKKKVFKSELKSSRYARRSLVLKNLKKGELINEANIISLRPVKGIPVENFNLVVGKKLKSIKRLDNIYCIKKFINLREK